MSTCLGNYRYGCRCSTCREAALAGQRDWHGRNPEKQLEYDLRHRYGITPEAYADLFHRQGGVCAICRQPETATRNGTLKRLAVDHCHETGGVRGLLCANCNRAIGLLGHDTARAKAAAQYLQKDPRLTLI